MKIAKTLLSTAFLGLVLACQNAARAEEQYELTILPGLNLIANQLDHGGNTLNEILPGVPDGSRLYKLGQGGGFDLMASYSSDDASWTPADATLQPGQGAFLQNPTGSAYSILFTGTRRIPSLPIPEIYQAGTYLLSRQVPEPATYEDITGAMPCGPVFVTPWNAALQTYGPAYSYDPDSSFWSPSDPILGVGEAAVIDIAAPCVGQPALRLTCPGDKTVSCGADWTFDAPTATSTCPGSDPIITVLSTVTNGNCPQRITRTWSASDGCDQHSTCSQTVSIQDTTPPQLVCAPNKNVEYGSIWDFDAPAATDLCGDQNVTVTVLDTVTNGTCPALITRTWEAADACNNRATCSQTVTVADSTPPVLSGCSDLIVPADSGGTNATVRFSVSATDNGSGIPVVCTPPDAAPFPVGTTTVRCVAVDACANQTTCDFTVTVRASRGDLFVEDTPYNYEGAPDLGSEPDPNMAGQNMWMSRAIWVHQNCAAPFGTFESHENPRYGQTNCVLVRVQNRGQATVSGAELKVYVANASMGLAWPNGWTPIGTYPLPAIAGGDSHVAQLPWWPEGTGHYCLLARIVSPDDPMASPETASISANVRANNNLAWRNVNVLNLLRATGDSIEVRLHALPRPKQPQGGGRQEPQPRRPVTVVCKTEALFHEGHGEATLNLGPLFKRWQDNGGHGANITVIGETTLRITNTLARIEDIPMDDDEDGIINLTIKAPEPLPVAGTSHVCHVELDQEQDGETVGGVNYGVHMRALHTDTDGDGIPDVLDDDDDNDGVPDVDDADPLGDPDCRPSALTIRLVDHQVVVSWSGFGYRLETANEIDGPWRPLPTATSPYLVPPIENYRFFRLICH